MVHKLSDKEKKMITVTLSEKDFEEFNNGAVILAKEDKTGEFLIKIEKEED